MSSTGALRRFAIAAVVIGLLALGWSVATAYGVFDASTSISYQPPPPGETEAVARERFHPQVLWLLVLPGIAAVLAVLTVVLGAAGLIRRRGTPWWAPIPAVVAVVVATLGPLLSSGAAHEGIFGAPAPPSSGAP